MHRNRLGIAALALAGTLAACNEAGTPTITALPSPDVSAIQLGNLEPGRYTHPAFTPRIELEVPDEGEWTSFHVSSNFFDVGIETDAGPVDVTFLKPSAFVTDEGEVEAATPADALQLLSARPGVALSPARPVQIDGLAGLEVDLEFENENTHVMRVEGGLIGFGPGNDVRLAFFEAGGGVLVIGLVAPAGEMAEAERLTQAVRDSIQIGEG